MLSGPIFLSLALEPFLAAAASPGAELKPLPLGLFDALLVIVVAAGFWIGRKRGLSEELIPMVKWLLILVVAGLLYAPLGGLVTELLQSTRVTANIVACLLIVTALHFIFIPMDRAATAKMLQSDWFGRWEYKLGLLAGGVRFACIWLLFLSLLNARLYTDSELAANRKAQEKEVGTVLVPTWGMLQRSALHDSFTGPHLRKWLAWVLITPVPYEPYRPRGAKPPPPPTITKATNSPPPAPVPTPPPATK